MERVIAAADLARVAPLVDRERELGLLREALKEASWGSPRVVILSGEPGIGKTRLAEETINLARSSGAHAAMASCQQDVDVPYLPIATILRPLLVAAETQATGARAADRAAVRELIYGPAAGGVTGVPGDPGAGKMRLFLAMSELVVWSARTSPTVIVIDDVQWADASTLEFLGHLVPFVSQRFGAEPVRLLLVLSHRSMPDDPVARTLARLAREPIARRAEVARLDELATFELLIGYGIDRPSAALRSVVAGVAEGNPLLVGEILHRLAEDGSLVDTGRGVDCTASPSDLTQPADVTEAVAGRLRSVGAPCAAMLEVASFLGDEFTADALCAVTGTARPHADALLDEAMAARLVAARGTGYRFVQPLLRQALYDRLSGVRRREMHNHVATSLASLFGDDALEHAVEIAHHLVRAETEADRKAVGRFAAAAARRAEALGAWGEAAAFYECALAADRTGASPELSERAGMARGHNGDMDAAVDHLERVVRCARDAGDVAMWGRALLWQMRARIAHGRDALGGRIEAAPLDEFVAASAGEPALKAAALAVLAEIRFGARDFSAALTLVGQATRLAVESGDHESAARAASAAGLARLGRLELDEAAGWFERAEHHAREASVQGMRLAGGTNLPLVHWMAGRLDEAAESAERICESAAERCEWGYHAMASSVLAGVALARGDLSAVESHGSEALQMLYRSDYAWAGSVVYPVLACARALRGDRDGAARTIADAPLGGAGLRILLAAYSGRGAEVEELLARRPGPAPAEPSLFDFDRVLAPLEAGAKPHESVAPWLDRAAALGVVLAPGWCFFVPRLCGMAARHAGLAELAERRLDDALHQARAAGARLEVGRTHLELARLLLDTGDRARASEQLAQAWEVLELIGARALTAEVRATADAAGIALADVSLAARRETRERDQTAGGLRVILYSDIVESTELNVRAGDAAYVELMHAHDDLVRRRIEAFGGVEFKHTGDGICAWFRSASAALDCARHIQEDLNELARSRPETPVRLRIGLAAGEPQVVGSDLRGLAVAIAARVCAAAAGGQVLVADSVRQLTDGQLYRFELSGTYPLKGLPGEHQIFELVTREEGLGA